MFIARIIGRQDEENHPTIKQIFVSFLINCFRENFVAKT
jgi:hypothetical protein